MDFHELPDGVTAKHVAEMHQADLKIEHKYNCRGLTYWCDEKRQTAFCLIVAPNKQSIVALHEKAHGAVPQRIIEVNDTIVESFLGRIEDPEKSQNTTLNIINDPAFRTIMYINLKKAVLRTTEINTLNTAVCGYNKSIVYYTNSHNGRIVKQEANTFLISFDNVTNAVVCAKKIQKTYNCIITPDLEFRIGISAGVPVTEKDSIFEDTIKVAERLSNHIKGKIVVTSEVKDLYESENLNNSIDSTIVRTINSKNEIFLNSLVDFTEKEWNNPTLTADDYCKNLGFSKSQLYRKMIANTGQSPNTFLKHYRLGKALNLLDKQEDNISEIAFKTGFNSPAYFSKCFQETYGVLPSVYFKLNTSE